MMENWVIFPCLHVHVCKFSKTRITFSKTQITFLENSLQHWENSVLKMQKLSFSEISMAWMSWLVSKKKACIRHLNFSRARTWWRHCWRTTTKSRARDSNQRLRKQECLLDNSAITQPEKGTLDSRWKEFKGTMIQGRWHPAPGHVVGQRVAREPGYSVTPDFCRLARCRRHFFRSFKITFAFC